MNSRKVAIVTTVTDVDFGNTQLSLFKETPLPPPRKTREELLLQHLQHYGTVSANKAITQLGFTAEELFASVQNLRKAHIVETCLVNTDNSTLYSYIRYIKPL